MVKIFNDTFNINELIDSNSTEVLLENEFTIPDEAPDIEKIITVEGKAEINNAKARSDSIIVDGKLIYNIIYRSNNDDYSIYSLKGEIPFSEEISAEGLAEDMDVFSNASIDYIDAEQITERTYLVKSVLVLDNEVYRKRPVTYISNLESDGSIQAKTKNISYTDTAAELSEEVNINDAVEVGKGSGEISGIIKSEADVYITNIDMLNDKVLLEGICKVGFIFIEDDDMHSIGYVSEEFPFTHYLELANADDSMLKDIKLAVGDMTFSTTENFDNEKKLIEFALPLVVKASFYDTKERNIIADCYSTDYELELQSQKINLSSLKNITDTIIKYENNFDVLSGTIRDIYSVDVSPKVSEQRLDGGKYVIDGFLDVNMLYLNGEINKIDKAFASLPFTAEIPIDDDEASCTIQSRVRADKCNAYRKGNKSVNLSCDLNVGLKFKNDGEITVISDLAETDPLDRSKMPSLVFRLVQEGESLWDIAKNYNLSINYLKEVNDLPEDNLLTPGSKIIIVRTI